MLFIPLFVKKDTRRPAPFRLRARLFQQLIPTWGRLGVGARSENLLQFLVLKRAGPEVGRHANSLVSDVLPPSVQTTYAGLEQSSKWTGPWCLIEVPETTSENYAQIP